MKDKLISANALRQDMYERAFQRNDGLQKWDSGLWIRYKMFEACVLDAAEVEQITCKDCKFAELTEDGGWNKHCKMLDCGQYSDFYCKYATKKEETK